MGGMIMKKYFFISYKAINEKREVGCGWLVVVCSCCLERMYDAIIDYYNERAKYKANSITITALTILDKHTAAQLSNNFTDFALIIDDGDNAEEEHEASVDSWIARDMSGMLYLYVGNKPPQKKDTYWMTGDGDCAEMGSDLFQEVKWSNDEPTKVKLLIDNE